MNLPNFVLNYLVGTLVQVVFSDLLQELSLSHNAVVLLLVDQVNLFQSPRLLLGLLFPSIFPITQVQLPLHIFFGLQAMAISVPIHDCIG